MLRIKLTVSALIIGVAGCVSLLFAQQSQTNNQAPGAQQAAAPAQSSRRGLRRRGKMGRERALQEINLTDVQKQQVRTMIQNQGQGTKTQREELRALKQKSRSGVLTPEGQTRAKELRAQLRESRKTVHAQMMNLLTAEQKAKLQEMREARRANHEMLGRRKRRLD